MSRLAVLAVLVVLVGAGCGLPNGTVEPIEKTRVPYGLLAPAPSDQPTPSGNGLQKTSPRLFLLDREERLVPVPTVVDAGTVSWVARQVLQKLDDGPSESERSAGLASALGPGVSLSLLQVRETTALVDLSVPSRGPVPGRLPLAFGQVVLSLTSVAGIERVQFMQDESPLEVALPGGARTTTPVTAEDYAALIAPGTSPTEKVEPSPPSPSG